MNDVSLKIKTFLVDQLSLRSILNETLSLKDSALFSRPWSFWNQNICVELSSQNQSLKHFFKGMLHKWPLIETIWKSWPLWKKCWLVSCFQNVSLKQQQQQQQQQHEHETSWLNLLQLQVLLQRFFWHWIWMVHAFFGSIEGPLASQSTSSASFFSNDFEPSSIGTAPSFTEGFFSRIFERSEPAGCQIQKSEPSEIKRFECNYHHKTISSNNSLQLHKCLFLEIINLKALNPLIKQTNFQNHF